MSKCRNRQLRKSTKFMFHLSLHKIHKYKMPDKCQDKQRPKMVANYMPRKTKKKNGKRSHCSRGSKADQETETDTETEKKKNPRQTLETKYDGNENSKGHFSSRLSMLLLLALQTGALWKISLLNYKACHV